MPVLWPVLARVESDASWVRPPPGQGAVSYSRKRIQDGGNCPTLSGPGIRSRLVTVSKTLTPVGVAVVSFTATYNSLRLLMARCGIATLSGPSTVVRRSPVEGLNVTRELTEVPLVTTAKPFVDETLSKSVISPPRAASVMLRLGS